MNYVTRAATHTKKEKVLKNQNFTTSILVDQTPSVVFDAVTNPRGWWSKEIKGGTKKLNDEFTFEVEGVHFSKQKLMEVIPNKKVVWQITEASMSFLKNKSEWTGTKVVFDISKKGDKTQLTFTHEGLVPEAECYGACAPAWTQYVQHSLLQMIKSGKGDPNLEGTRTEKISKAGA